MVIHDNVANKDTIQAWINSWYPLAARAVYTITSFLEMPLAIGRTPLPISESLAGFYRDYLRSMNLKAG